MKKITEITREKAKNYMLEELKGLQKGNEKSLEKRASQMEIMTYEKLKKVGVEDYNLAIELLVQIIREGNIESEIKKSNSSNKNDFKSAVLVEAVFNPQKLPQNLTRLSQVPTFPQMLLFLINTRFDIMPLLERQDIISDNFQPRNSMPSLSVEEYTITSSRQALERIIQQAQETFRRLENNYLNQILEPEQKSNSQEGKFNDENSIPIIGQIYSEYSDFRHENFPHLVEEVEAKEVIVQTCPSPILLRATKLYEIGTLSPSTPKSSPNLPLLVGGNCMLPEISNIETTLQSPGASSAESYNLEYFDSYSDATMDEDDKLKISLSYSNEIIICKDLTLVDQEASKRETEEKISPPFDSVEPMEGDWGQLPKMKYMLENAEDVTFLIRNQWGGAFPISAHKKILYSMSKKLDALVYPQDEDKNKHIYISIPLKSEDVNNTTPEVFRRMLKYIYCGSIDDFDEFGNTKETLELLYLAITFELKDLSNRCIEVLSTAINKS